MHTINPRALTTLQKIRDGEVPYPPMWETVPVTLIEVEPGCVRMSTMADERHINAFGAVHGGYVAAALDTALGLTVFISLDDEQARHTTVDLAVKMVRRVPLHTALTIETRLVHISRSIGVSEAVLRDQDNTTYAHGTTTCLIKR